MINTALLILLALLWPSRAFAHAWGNSYTLPIPFALYAYGASAALVVSFVLVAYFAKAGVATGNHVRPPDAGGLEPASTKPVALAKIVSVLGLGLTIGTGLFGNPSPFANFSMAFFWVIFVLGFAYLTAFIGDLYALINPWNVLCAWVEKLWPQAFVARRSYPRRAGYWPAIALYGAFIWIELFGHAGPRYLAVALIAYTAITLLGAATFGRQAWFQHGEFFGVFLRLVAKLAPLERIVLHGRPTWRFRRPFAALTDARADHQTLGLFVLFMLSSTAFDGAHETLPWAHIFWIQIFPRLEPLILWFGFGPFDVAASLYYVWQWIMLALSPFFYYAIYMLFMWLTKIVTRSALPAGQLALHFALGLIPIAFVYHAAHYFMLLLTEGPNIVARASDPFGFGWDLFGTATLDLSIIPPAGVVWHTQVWLILIGHIVSVYVAHVQALQVFPTRAQAMRSQLPMLVLMVVLTSLGLWICRCRSRPVRSCHPRPSGRMRHAPCARASDRCVSLSTAIAGTTISKSPRSKSSQGDRIQPNDGISSDTFTREGETMTFAKYGAGGLVCGLVVYALLTGSGPIAEAASKGPSGLHNPTVPKPTSCASGNQREQALQGQVPAAVRAIGFKGYNCNLALVGQHAGIGGGISFVSYKDDHGHYCAFYSDSKGVNVLDITDPAKPVLTTSLTSKAMMSSMETLRAHPQRQLLIAVGREAPDFDVYDLSADCRQPKVLWSGPLNPGDNGGPALVQPLRGHDTNFAPDGMTLYNGSNTTKTYAAIDMTDPTKPKLIAQIDQSKAPLALGRSNGLPHGLSISTDGNRGYFTSLGLPQVAQLKDPDFKPSDGFYVIDTSEIQARKPDPQTKIISYMAFRNESGAQHTLSVKIGGKPYMIFVTEGGAAGIPAGGGGTPQQACDAGLTPFPMAHIIDMRDEANPKLVADLALETHDLNNCTKVMPDTVGEGLFIYGSHNCSVDNRENATALACSYWQSGIRVFDIRDPAKPKEIAYYNPAPVTEAAVPTGGTRPLTVNTCGAPMGFDFERKLLTTMCQRSGALILQFERGVWPFKESTPTPRTVSYN